ncbi:LolA family protein [Winogradskyella algicola]|uniref:LolA family protein n=1 Tax=Winogradskyella algicola TaxID=2575815 RepID=UPI0011089FF6|nr:outer membrane lipoprotein-sorting protein [Winogradskyella algicola]
MKRLKLMMLSVAFVLTASITAQTAEEIVANYFENTGGIDAWRAIEGMKMSAKVNQGGMEIPIEIIQLKDGRQMTRITFQGKTMKQGVFDGETLWSTNFMTQKAEKSDAEATANFKLEAGDFPDAFLDYKDKGYTVELMGKEDFAGTETFKIKLTKQPVTIDGKQEENVYFYYFDTENYVPLAMQNEIKQGQAKGMIQEITFSDYQEAGDIYMPYTMTQGIKDGQSQPISMDTIEVNPKVDDKEFKFPEGETTETENKN